MEVNIDADVVESLRDHLGSQLPALRDVMRDLDVFPSFLFVDDHRRLSEAREAAERSVDSWIVQHPQAAQSAGTAISEMFRRPSLSETLLAALIWSTFADPLVPTFDLPSPTSRLFSTLPLLSSRLDESGLVHVGGLDARPWGLFAGGFALHYHPLLRRSFRARVHYGLISLLLNVAEREALSLRLALDDRLLRYPHEYEEIHEFDYWYGPPFQADELDDLRAVGEAFFGDPASGTSFLNPYAGLSVRWTADGPLKTVQIEEFMPHPDGNEEWVFARYLHAIRDTEKNAFVHCDGAVKAYASDRYPTTQGEFRNRGKGDRYRKVFRIDGEFPSSAWSDVATVWFRGNNLIKEYFDPEGA